MQDIAVKLDALRSRRYENLSSSIVWCQQPLTFPCINGGGGGGGGGLQGRPLAAILLKQWDTGGVQYIGATSYLCYISSRPPQSYYVESLGLHRQGGGGPKEGSDRTCGGFGLVSCYFIVYC